MTNKSDPIDAFTCKLRMNLLGLSLGASLVLLATWTAHCPEYKSIQYLTCCPLWTMVLRLSRHSRRGRMYLTSRRLKAGSQCSVTSVITPRRPMLTYIHGQEIKLVITVDPESIMLKTQFHCQCRSCTNIVLAKFFTVWYHVAGNFWGRNSGNFHKFQFESHPRSLRKFSPSKFSRYTVYSIIIRPSTVSDFQSWKSYTIIMGLVITTASMYLSCFEDVFVFLRWEC